MRVPFIKTISLIARELVVRFISDYLFLPMYVMAVFFIKSYYERQARLQVNLAGRRPKKVKELIEESVLYGLVAGFIGSIVVVYMGLTLSPEAVKYLFGIMAAALLINIRYTCLSYTAGILAAASLVFHITGVNITSLLLLVSVAHGIESILIFLNRKKDHIPVYIRHKGRITGGFLTQKFWPVPIVLLTLTVQMNGSGIERFALWNWWPAFVQGDVRSGIAALAMGCIVTVVGYSNITVTKLPERKGLEEAIQFLSYSIILMIIALLSANIYAFKIIGVVFAIAAHEGIILYNHYRERHDHPMFDSVKRGVRILDVLPEGYAQKMGVRRGDVILSINGKDVQTEEGIRHIMNDFPTFIWINALGPDGAQKNYEYKCYPYGANELGILTVPREREVTYNIDYFEKLAVIKNLVARFRNFGQ